MKLAALLCGVVASVFAWAASQFLSDMGATFLALWPATKSQQFFGSIAWQALCAAGIVGGLVTVLRPWFGGLLLLAAAVGWAVAGTRLASGFDLQLLVPLVFNAAAGISAFGAAIRGFLRRRAARRASKLDAKETDPAQRLEPSIELHHAVEEQRELDSVVLQQDEPPPPEPEPEPAPVRASSDAPPRRRLGGLLVANLAVLLVLCGAIALLLYVDIRTGHLAAAFAPVSSGNALTPLGPPAPAPTASAETGDVTGTAVTAANRQAPVLDAGVKPGSASDTAVKSARELLTASLDRSRLATGGAPAAEVRVSTAPLEVAAIGPTEWTDPFSYCAAMGTIDFPDRRYAGPAVALAIVETLRVPASSPPDRVKWRCVDGSVWACASFDWPVCAMTPSLTEMVEFCAKNPNAIGLQAPSGNWSCEGTRPVIPEGENWPVDERGFLPSAWIEIKPPSPPGSIG